MEMVVEEEDLACKKKSYHFCLQSLSPSLSLSGYIYESCDMWLPVGRRIGPSANVNLDNKLAQQPNSSLCFLFFHGYI